MIILDIYLYIHVTYMQCSVKSCLNLQHHVDTMSGSFTEPGGGGETGTTLNQLEDSELSNIIGSFEPLKESVLHALARN